MECYTTTSEDEIQKNTTVTDNFREPFKYFKRRKPPPDLNGVLRIDNSFENGTPLFPNPLRNIEELEAKSLGLIPSVSWKIWNISAHPGLLVIQNPFTTEGQLKWIHKCLIEFPCLPNKTNLDVHGITQSDKSWWEQATSVEGKKSDLLKKLRWATLGYHHNWDTKEYSEAMRGAMPAELVTLCDLIAKVLGFEGFKAEAAIINFYHLDSSLGPHTDHSEPNRAAPLFSFSFGQGAVFLIGGPTKEMKPTALLLRSGDVIIMAGAARLAYHAVPRIVQVTEEPWKTDFCKVYNPSEKNCESECNGSHMSTDVLQTEHYNDMTNIFEYIKASRINMNIRQVLKSSMCSLAS